MLSVALLVFAGAAGTRARAQTPDTGFAPPIAGTWQPIRSLGQPPRVKPHVSLGFGFDRLEPEYQAGVTGAVGWSYDLTNPILGLLSVTGELYAGQRGRDQPRSHLQPAVDRSDQ